MADFTVTVDEEIIEVLETMAKLNGTTVEELLSDMLMQNLEQIKARMNDPLIGALASVEGGETDISERVEDILRDEWQPD